jgi:hypothetical protein
MEYRAGRKTRVIGGGADAGQAPADSPGADDVSPLARPAEPSVAHPDELTPIPRREVDQSGVDSVDEQLAATGEPVVAVDDGKKKIHGGSLRRGEAVGLVAPDDVDTAVAL